MHLSDVAAPILCSHALHGKERVMACRSILFRFHGTYLLTSHAVSSSLLTSFCKRKSSLQVFETFLSGFSSKGFERHRCSQSSSVTNSLRSKTSLSSAVGCNHGWMHLLRFFFVPRPWLLVVDAVEQCIALLTAGSQLELPCSGCLY